MYKYILFDLDGTLTDSQEGIMNCITYALKKMGRSIPDKDTLFKFIGPPLQDSFAVYCGLCARETELAIELFRERYNPIGKFENTPAPGMAELLLELKEQGYVLALASSKPEKICIDICKKFGFFPSLSVITGSAPGDDWDKADVLRETFSRLGLKNEDLAYVLMVGDRKFDVLGAKECGIDCAGVEFFGYAEEGELENAGAAAVFKTASELREFILTH